MKGKILKLSALFAMLLVGLLCSIRTTYAYNEPASIMKNEATTVSNNETLGYNLRPLASRSDVFSVGEKLYFGGENMEAVQNWFRDNVHDLNTKINVDLFQYTPNDYWGIRYDPMTGSLTSYNTDGNPTNDDKQLFALDNRILLATHSREYTELELAFGYSEDGRTALSYSFAVSEESGQSEIAQLLIDCFYYEYSEVTLGAETNNYYQGMKYSISGKISEKKDVTITNGRNFTNIIPVVNKVEDRTAKLYISAEFPLTVAYSDLNSFKSDIKIIMLDSNMRLIGESVATPKKQIDVSENNVAFNFMYSSSQFTQVNARYLLISVGGEYIGTTGQTVTISPVSTNSMCIKYITSNMDDAFSYIDMVEPTYGVAKSSVTWNEESGKTGSVYNYAVSSNTQLEEVLTQITALDSSLNELDLNAYSLLSDSADTMGKTYSYIVKATVNDVTEFLVINLEIVDTEAPIIYGSSTYTVSAGSKLNINTIKNSLYIYDNVDENVSIYVKSDSYTENAAIPGEYIVVFYSKDSSNNYSEFNVKIVVEDKTGPSFYNENGVKVTSMTVYKSLDSVFLLNDVKGLIKAVDKVEGEINKINVERDGYTGNGDKLGSYKIILCALDSSKNIGYFEVDIVVDDSMPSNTLLLDGKLIITQSSTRLSKNDIANMMKLNNLYNDGTTSYINMDTSNYDVNYNVEGEYLVGYSISTTSGNYTEGTMIIRVENSRTSSDTIQNNKVEESKDGFIMKILKWIFNFFKKIFNWFLNLFE